MLSKESVSILKKATEGNWWVFDQCVNDSKSAYLEKKKSYGVCIGSEFARRYRHAHSEDYRRRKKITVERHEAFLKYRNSYSYLSDRLRLQRMIFCKEDPRVKWRQTINKVLRIIRLKYAMVSLSQVKSTRTAIQTQYRMLHGRQNHMRKLRFDTDNYASERARIMVPKWAKKIIAKPSADRTDRNCQRLHALLRGHHSFDKFTLMVQIAMCRSMTYQFAESDRIILREGHVGQYFYFIFSGSVFVNLTDRIEGKPEVVRTEAVLMRGDAFGEIALLKDVKRTASIACRDDCELFVVDKDVFSCVCPQIFELELSEMLKFIKLVDIFQMKIWTEEKLKKLCQNSQMQEFKMNKLIVSNSMKCPWIYICMEGECNIVMPLNIQSATASERAPSVVNREFTMPEIAVHEPVSEDDNSSDGGEGNRIKQKQTMLQSMRLEYTNKDKLSLPGLQSVGNSNVSNDVAKVYRSQRRSSEQPKSIHTLIHEHRQTVHVVIGKLVPKQVFNMVGIMQTAEERKTSPYRLILVSQGAKLLRIRMDCFMMSLDYKSKIRLREVANKTPRITE